MIPDRDDGQGLTVIAWTTWVVPGVTSEVIEATELYVPALLAETSKCSVAVPPAAGGDVSTDHSVLLAGAEAKFLPLVPSRFSAPQLIGNATGSSRIAGGRVGGAEGHGDLLARRPAAGCAGGQLEPELAGMGGRSC